MERFAKTMIENELPFSTLDLYKNNSDFRPTHIEQTFESTLANEDLAAMLKIPKGFPLLNLTSIVYQHKQPLEYKEAYYKGDMYKFFITRQLDA
jgi:GntR family transcriptional regulator